MRESRPLPSLKGWIARNTTIKMPISIRGWCLSINGFLHPSGCFKRRGGSNITPQLSAYAAETPSRVRIGLAAVVQDPFASCAGVGFAVAYEVFPGAHGVTIHV